MQTGTNILLHLQSYMQTQAYKLYFKTNLYQYEKKIQKVDDGPLNTVIVTTNENIHAVEIRTGEHFKVEKNHTLNCSENEFSIEEIRKHIFRKANVNSSTYHLIYWDQSV